MKNDSEKRYRSLLREQERSGLSVLEFARQRGVPSANLYWWRKRLRQTAEGALVAVRVVEDAAAAATGPTPGGDGFELALSGGLVLRIPAGFNESDLRRLLTVLAERC